jgi:hypothetical protein
MRQEYENLKINHTANKISLTSQFAELRNLRDSMRTRNDLAEDDLARNGERYTDEVRALVIFIDFHLI